MLSKHFQEADDVAKEQFVTYSLIIIIAIVLKKIDELITDYNIPKSEYLDYITLRHSIEKCVSIENVLYCDNLQNKNAVKLWYSTLNDSIGDQFDVCAKKWARYLHKREEELSWNGIWKNARQLFRCIKNKLRQFKILNRLYYTPSKLFTVVLQEDSKCPKCGNADGTLFHLLWDCHKIKEIWFGITKHTMNYIKYSTNTRVMYIRRSM